VFFYTENYNKEWDFCKGGNIGGAIFKVVIQYHHLEKFILFFSMRTSHSEYAPVGCFGVLIHLYMQEK